MESNKIDCFLNDPTSYMWEDLKLNRLNTIIYIYEEDPKFNHICIQDADESTHYFELPEGLIDDLIYAGCRVVFKPRLNELQRKNIDEKNSIDLVKAEITVTMRDLTQTKTPVYLLGNDTVN